MGAYRDYISEDADMQTMIFRYSVLVDAFNAHLPDDVKCSQSLSADVRKKILKEPYSEQNDRLIMLFGMGIVDEETVKNVILFNKSDWLEDAIALENKVRRNEEREIDSDNGNLSKIFTVCANSRKYSEISDIPFEIIEKILTSPYAAAVNGFIHISQELLKFMNDAGIRFGFYDQERDEMAAENPEYIAQAADSEQYDIYSETAPIPFDYAALNCCLSVFGKNYASDFMEYVKENNIPYTDEFISEYEKYLNDVKLCFDIKAYLKKRTICGDTINYFDYSHNVMNEGKLVKATLEAEEDYTAQIHIESDEIYSENELEMLALKKYLSSRQPRENMIIEVYHCRKIRLYIYRDNSFNELASDAEELFRKQLFDFNEIWSVIKECSDSGSLRRTKETIIMSSDFMEQIRPEWRKYAEQIIAEQFGRRKRNMIAATLNELKNAATKLSKPKPERDVGAAMLPSDKDN